MRFERSKFQIPGFKLFSRAEVSRLAFQRATDRGMFLARLWAHFGEPSPRDGGFIYYLRDSETALHFTAYTGVGGASYGGELHEQRLLRPVIEAFERMLETTIPVDCAFEYLAERNHGGGKRVMGCKAGRSFDIADRRNRSRDERRGAAL